MSYFYYNGLWVKQVMFPFPVQEPQAELILDDLETFMFNAGYPYCHIVVLLDELNDTSVNFIIEEYGDDFDPAEWDTFLQVMHHMEELENWGSLPSIYKMMDAQKWLGTFFYFEHRDFNQAWEHIIQYPEMLLDAGYDLNEFALEWMANMLEHYLQQPPSPDEVIDLWNGLVAVKLEYG